MAETCHPAGSRPKRPQRLGAGGVEPFSACTRRRRGDEGRPTCFQRGSTPA